MKRGLNSFGTLELRFIPQRGISVEDCAERFTREGPNPIAYYSMINV